MRLASGGAAASDEALEDASHAIAPPSHRRLPPPRCWLRRCWLRGVRHLRGRGRRQGCAQDAGTGRARAASAPPFVRGSAGGAREGPPNLGGGVDEGLGEVPMLVVVQRSLHDVFLLLLELIQ